eukprot:257667_1
MSTLHATRCVAMNGFFKFWFLIAITIQTLLSFLLLFIHKDATVNILSLNYNNQSNYELLSCNNPAYFMWYKVNTFGLLYKKLFLQHGFNINCSVDEIPSEFRDFKDYRGKNSFICLKYNNETKPYNQEFCNGARLFHMPCQLCYGGLTRCDMPMFMPINKTGLHTILTNYCEKHYNNTNICNFKILGYNMKDTKQRIEFLTKHIDCTNNNAQHDKTWVFKEDKHCSDGIHFENNHELIYKLISPNHTEQNIYYKNCSSIKPFNRPKYFKKNHFTYNKKKNGKGFHVSYESLLMEEFVSNPLLIEERAFHIRSFLSIPSISKPFIVLHYPEGLIFRNIRKYNNKKLNKNILSSNGAIADGANKKLKAKTGVHFKQVWGYHRFQNYLNNIYTNKTLKMFINNYTTYKLPKDIQHIIKHVFNANKYYKNNEMNNMNNKKKVKQMFTFSTYCMDLIINDKFELKLLEINENCGTYCPSYWYDDILDNDGNDWMCEGFVNESVNILLEIYKKRYNNHVIKTIESLNRFKIAFWSND